MTRFLTFAALALGAASQSTSALAHGGHGAPSTHSHEVDMLVAAVAVIGSIVAFAFFTRNSAQR